MLCESDVWVMDTESDGFVEQSSVIWIAVSQNLKSGEQKVFVRPGQDFVDHLKEVPIVVMHNLIQHDRPLIMKLLGYKIPLGKCFDTLLVSQFLHPDREVPEGWEGKQTTPNSIEAWGMRLGRHKPEHEDWSQYSEEMKVRCCEDVEINRLVFRELMKEWEMLYNEPQ